MLLVGVAGVVPVPLVVVVALDSGYRGSSACSGYGRESGGVTSSAVEVARLCCVAPLLRA